MKKGTRNFEAQINSTKTNQYTANDGSNTQTQTTPSIFFSFNKPCKEREWIRNTLKRKSEKTSDPMQTKEAVKMSYIYLSINVRKK